MSYFKTIFFKDTPKIEIQSEILIIVIEYGVEILFLNIILFFSNILTNSTLKKNIYTISKVHKISVILYVPDKIQESRIH